MQDITSHRPLLESLFWEAIDACHPGKALASHLPAIRANGREIVLGVGKASIEMAAVVNRHFAGNVEGAVISRHGQGKDIDTGKIEKFYANHPIPDAAGVDSAKRIVALADELERGDRVHFLVSGGGSALFTLPADGLSLPKLKEITDHLVKSGLPINEINCVRRHLSQVSGGRFAKMVEPAELVTYSISDVVGDAPEDIASGPTVLSKNEPDRVLDLLERSGYAVDSSLARIVNTNAMPEAVNGHYKLVASAADAIERVSRSLSNQGWQVVNLGVDLQGEAATLGAMHAQHIAATVSAADKVAFVSGGELTVTVTNTDGAGGPNLEYLAALAEMMPRQHSFLAMACDTDGIDGSEDNAGGFVSSDDKKTIEEKNLSIRQFLEKNQSYALFSEIDGLFKTGPTGTNVNDVRIVLCE